MVENRSVAAYDVAKRALSYDRNMDIMHPNRHIMADLIVDILATSKQKLPTVIDIGSGTGFLLKKLLVRFPELKIIAIDGASEMTEVAKVALGNLAERVDFRIGSFQNIGEICTDLNAVDGIVSLLSLHHLDVPEKSQVLKMANKLMTPGSWFLNGDLVCSEDDFLEDITQKLRINGILKRGQNIDPRFSEYDKIRTMIDELEENEGDKPQKLATDLKLLENSGFIHNSIFWKETREALWGGIKTDTHSKIF